MLEFTEIDMRAWSMSDIRQGDPDGDSYVEGPEKSSVVLLSIVSLAGIPLNLPADSPDDFHFTGLKGCP